MSVAVAVSGAVTAVLSILTAAVVSSIFTTPTSSPFRALFNACSVASQFNAS